MTSEKEKHVIRFDWAIKRLLRDKANPVVLEGFLTSLLGKEIKILDFLESEGNKYRADEKTNRVDIVAKDASGARILIEVQNETENEYFHRILFGTSRMIVDHIKTGERYDKVPKVYSINIVFFELGNKSDYVYHGFTEFLGLHNKQPLLLKDSMNKKFEVAKPGEILPEYYILIAKDFDKWSKTPLDQWMYYLSTNMIPADADAPGLQEARVQLDIDNLSDEDRNAYYKHLDNMRSLVSAVESAYEDGEYAGFDKGLQKGITEGRVEGELKKSIDVAKTAINMGFDDKAIQKLSGLSIEEIQKLR
ncbi:MAG: Rpn family recombination-promoting nuclease/putative transposase [Muribaculaceae bacterium]|nr:Rpn family recombination-promoting nuclease/putative transposase [Muribaculaceae bacterium]